MVKCTHMPSRVPGSDQAARICRPTGSRPPCGGTGTDAGAPGGASRSSASTATNTSTPVAAMAPKVVLQPAVCRACARTTVVNRLPPVPTRPVSWATNGLRAAGNQRAAIRSTLMKVIASPQPSTARDASAGANAVENANASCPALIRATPSSSTRRGPIRSTSRPTGICIPAYTRTCRIEKVDSADAPIPNRAAASSPATPRLVRCTTART